MIRVGLISFLVTLCFFQEGLAGWCFGKSPSKCTTLEYTTQYINRKCFRIKECKRVYMANEGYRNNVTDIEREISAIKNATPQECKRLIGTVIARENYKNNVHPDNIRNGYVVPDVKLPGTIVKGNLTEQDFEKPSENFEGPHYDGCRTQEFLLTMTSEMKPGQKYDLSEGAEKLKACLSNGCRDALIETLNANNKACNEKNSLVPCRILRVSDTSWGAARRKG